MRVLVTGATGFIGRFGVRALLEAGHEVRALVRDRPRAGTLLPAAVELATGSALDDRAVRTALDGCDALVQCAGVYSYDRRHAARVLRETPALARAVLSAALESRTPRIVDIASAVVFTTETDRVDATTRLARPGDRVWADPYARAKVAAEEFAQALEAGGLPRVTLHPARVIGPEDSGPGTSGASLIALLRGGLTTDAHGGWVDVRDVAAAIVAGVGAPSGTHVVLSASSATYRDLAPRLDALTGRHPRRTFVPAAALRALARLNDVAAGRLADLPTAGGLEYVLTCPPVDGLSATAALGLSYRRFEETLADAIRWWAANGTIDSRLAGALAE